jgi:hypothetical protein
MQLVTPIASLPRRRAQPQALLGQARCRRTLLVALVACCGVGYGLSRTLDGSRVAPACAASTCTASTAAPAGLPNPCALLTGRDVAKAFGARVAYRTTQPESHQCSWNGVPFRDRYGQQGVTLSVARVSRADFVRSSSTWIAPGPVTGSRERARSVRFDGVGEIAFTQPGAGYDLEVWYRGIAIDISSTLLRTPLASEKHLAQAAIAWLRKARAETSAR